ncbi:MAG: hypothetical protein U0797_19055 [Gemmataceae bacterium]
MNKTLSLLTLAAIAPLAAAGSKPPFRPNTTFASGHNFHHVPPTHNFTGFKPTTFTTTTTTNTTFKPPFKPTFPPHHTTFHAGKTFGPTGTPFKGTTTNYFTANAVKFSGGFFYKGQSHQQWTKRFFSPRWKTWCFFCPFARSWFYFNATRGGFFPVTSIAMSPPAPSLPGAAFLPPGGAELPVAGPGEEPELPEAE